jgi:hypothetical protein
VRVRGERSPVDVAQPTSVTIATRNPIKTIRVKEIEAAFILANLA